MKLLGHRPDKHSNLMRLGELHRKADRFGLLMSSNRFEEIQDKLVYLDREGGKAKVQNVRKILELVENTKRELDQEYARINEAKGRPRGRRGIAGGAVLVGALTAVIYMKLESHVPGFIRQLPDNIENNFHLIATGIIAALALAFPVRDIFFQSRLDGVRLKGEEVLMEIKDDLLQIIESKGHPSERYKPEQ